MFPYFPIIFPDFVGDLPIFQCPEETLQALEEVVREASPAVVFLDEVRGLDLMAHPT